MNPVIFRMPSVGKMIVIFLIVGPMVWPLAMFFVEWSASTQATRWGGAIPAQKVPGSMLLGFLSWWSVAILVPSFWLFTWIPTIIGAVAFSLVFSTLPSWFRTFQTRACFAIVSSLVCAAISGIVFSLIAFSVLVPEKMEAICSVRRWVAIVATTGSIIGLIVGAWRKLSPREEGDAVAPQLIA